MIFSYLFLSKSFHKGNNFKGAEIHLNQCKLKFLDKKKKANLFNDKLAFCYKEWCYLVHNFFISNLFPNNLSDSDRTSSANLAELCRFSKDTKPRCRFHNEGAQVY